MSQIEILNKLGMVSEEDEAFTKTPTSWDKMLETLAKYDSPQAQALYKKLSTKYKVDK